MPGATDHWMVDPLGATHLALEDGGHRPGDPPSSSDTSQYLGV
jgi:hypothetical protein